MKTRMLEKLIFMLQRDPERNYFEAPTDEADHKKRGDAIKRGIVCALADTRFIVNDALAETLHCDLGLGADNITLTEVSPPFKNCWIQMPEGSFLETRREGWGSEKVYGVFLNETEPHCYDFAIVSDDLVDPEFAYRLKTGHLNTLKANQTKTYVWDVISTFLQPFARAHAIGVEQVNERVKLRIDGEKITHKIKEIVHVFPKTKQAKTEAEEKYRDIDWSHRWAVRGHWREVKGVGKDRSGAYCVKGFTWVVDFVKGPEDRPLVEKMRVIDYRFNKKEYTS